MVELELRDLARAIGEDPPKHTALVRHIAALLDEHRTVTVVAKTAASARGYAQMLRDAGMTDAAVTSLGALADAAPTDVALLTGTPPSWARWVFRAGIARSLHVLAYDNATGDLGLSGYTEMHAIRRTIALQTSRAHWLTEPAQRDRALTQLGGGNAGPAIRPPTVTADGGMPVDPDEPPDTPPGLWEERNWFSVTQAKGTGFGRPRESLVEASRITFTDGRWGLFDLDGTVTRWKSHSESVDEAASVAKLCVGDQLVVIDGDGHKHLMQKVLEVAESIPALAVAAEWTAHWRATLARAYRDAGRNYTELTRRLAHHGCTVQAQTVRLWVIGVTLGPDDAGDLRRLGLVTSDPVLTDHHLKVADAVRTLRGAHVRLGQRVARLSRTLGPAAQRRDDPDSLLDERSGLTAADFAHAVDILTIADINPAGPVPSLVTGTVHAPKEQM